MKIIYFIKMIFLIIIFRQTIQSCFEGCLKCNKNNQCLICDSSLHFKLEESKCIYEKLDNCSLSFVKGKCNICDTNFFVNESNNLCEKINTPITNCIYYSKQNTCIECDSEHYLQNNTCNKVLKKIADCAVYSSETICERCFENVLSLDKKSCQKLQNYDRNCAQRFYPQSCKECKFGYKLQKKINEQNLQDLVKDLFILNSLKFKSISYFKNSNICEPTDISFESKNNCQNQAFLKETCFECPVVTYLDSESKTCKSNPKIDVLQPLIIPHCFLIISSKECKKCFEGFYIHYSKKFCLPHKQRVSSCKIMHQQINEACILCENDFYLIDSYHCNKRQVKDPNCLEYNYFLDECISCQSNFVLINENAKCIAKIQNCENYFTGYNSITCLKCLTNYYLFQNACQILPDDKKKENCLSYNSDMFCDVCTEGYILIQDVDNQTFFCKLFSNNTQLKNCQKAQKIEDNFTCLNCSDYAIKITENQNCYPNTNLPQQCSKGIQVEQQWICSECEESYYLDTQNNQCRPAISNCKLYVTNQGDLGNKIPLCVVCKEGYILIENLCILPTQDNGDNCILKQSTNCVLCKEEFIYQITINTQETLICRLKEHFQKIQNCAVITRTSTNDIDHIFTCERCEKGFYLDFDQNVCRSCFDNKCTIIDLNNQIKVRRDLTVFCLVQKNNNCLSYQNKVPFYFNNETIVEQSFFFQNLKIYENIRQFKTSGFKENYSFYISAIFFVDQTNATSDTISHINCKEGIARNFTKSTLTKTNHDCMTTIQNCKIDSNFVISSEKRIFLSCRQCYYKQVPHFTKEIILESKMVEAIPNVTFNFLNISHLGDKLPSTFCYERILEQNQTIDQTDIITNCALYEVNLVINVFTRTCLECKPKYKKGSVNNKITCTEISNCFHSNKTSQCEICNKDYSLQNYDTCVQNLNKNCHTINDQNLCIKCINGFKYNSTSNSCEKVRNYICRNFDQGECIECRNPLELVFKHIPKQLSSPVICLPKTLQPKPQPSNCVLVDWKGFCVYCGNDFFPDLAGKCVPKSRFPKCKLFNMSNGTCYQCEKGYEYDHYTRQCFSVLNYKEDQSCTGEYFAPFIGNGGKNVICGNQIIGNCKDFHYSSLQSSQKFECKECENGFVKQINQNQNIKCLAFQPKTNCVIHRTDFSLNFYCIKCSSNYYLDNYNNCVDQFKIPKCIEYFDNSSKCKKCENEFFVQNGACQKRSKIYSTECSQYFIYLDECKIFKTQYIYEYLELIQNPPSIESLEIANAQQIDYVGIQGCEKYWDYTTCRQCSGNTYLKENSCFPVQTVLEHCKNYSDENFCQTCETGFILINNKCFEQKDLNCLVYKNENSCYTCTPQNPVLNELKKCEKNLNITNCKKFKSSSACEICVKDFYLKEDKCFQVEKKIDFCEQYNYDSSCLACQTGYFLLNGVCQINPTFDSNCQTFENTAYSCSQCHFGYILIDNKCLKCFDEKCGICDTNRDSCLMCKSGTWMNSEGKCQENVEFVKFRPYIVITSK